jgi:2-polyprenyl-6-hydroxyphenyl methylase/3-demethylubiquinone-9 3-methyltransferase
MSLDRRVHDYFSTPNTVSRWWNPDDGPLAFHYDAELMVLENELPIDPAWHVLDLGTGRGRVGASFASRGCRVEGVELNPDMLEAARDTARQQGVEDHFELHQGSAEDLSAFASDDFQLVTCMELFDHLPDLAPVLAEARRVLEPDGWFAFTYVPGASAYGAFGNVYRRVRGRRGERIISRTYSTREVRGALTAAGFELDGYFGLGVLCLSAQTRLFQNNVLVRAVTAVARAEARRWPYYRRPWLARHGAHVVGLARARPTSG